MHRLVHTVMAVSLTALTIGSTLDLTTSSAEARSYRAYDRGYRGRVGVGVAVGALAAGGLAASDGSYYNT